MLRYATLLEKVYKFMRKNPIKYISTEQKQLNNFIKSFKKTFKEKEYLDLCDEYYDDGFES